MQITDAKYKVSLQKTHSTVTIQPALTDAEWDEIERVGEDIVAQVNGRKPAALLFDLTPLNYMGSSTVAMIVRCWKALKQDNRSFVVVTGSDVVREVLELSGLSKMWTIVNTPEEGLKSLGISPRRAAKAAAGESSEGGWAAWLGVVALAAAGAGVGLWFAQPGERQVATGLIYGGAGSGFVMGLVVMMMSHSRRKILGLGVVLLSAGAGVFRLIQ